MRRFFICLIVLVFLLSSGGSYQAQGSTRSERGLPPIASLISISPPDNSGIVTVSGAVGAVFPGAQVIVRNLQTGETAYVTAGITGSFNTRLYGPGRTPFWVSASPVIPPELRDWQGTLPGGPGTIIYGNVLETFTSIDSITPLMMDGDSSEWNALSTATGGDAQGLRNRDSIYITLTNSSLSDGFSTANILLSVDNATYTITLSPQRLRQVNVEQQLPTRRNRGEFSANIGILEDTIELRIPLEIIDSPINSARITNLTLIDEAGAELAAVDYDAEISLVDQTDGAVYLETPISGGRNFSISGTIGRGVSRWSAQARVNTLTLSPGDEFSLELDVVLNTPNLPFTVENLTFLGDITLQPVGTAARFSNNGWSNVLTPGGLAIDNVAGDFLLTSARTEWNAVVRKQDRLIFGLQFKAVLPEDLPEGIYVPAFTGSVVQQNGTLQTWAETSLFGEGTLRGLAPITRLPITLNIGGLAEQRLNFVMFYDNPSNGMRGLLASQDREQVALSNRVKFNSETYTLPPGNYPIEPYLPNIMSNRHDMTLSPLIPFLFPSGRLNASVTRPDGTVEDLGTAPIVQSTLSTDAIDDRERFGVQSPMDMFRLTTLNPKLFAYNFDIYGTYTVELTGNVEDLWGNRYVGGGTYTVTIAEPVSILPGVLPGTPFEVGDTFYPGVRLIPAVEADVSVSFRVYPLDGSGVIEKSVSGTANRHGYFIPVAENAGLTVDTAGEYIVDYLVTFTGEDGRIRAGTLRGAGVIADPQNQMVAHGRRGISDYVPRRDEPRPAWFTTRVYPQEGTAAPVLNAPYNRGDIAIYADTDTSGMKPLIQVQDLTGSYGPWLEGIIPDFTTSNGEDLTDNILKDSLPLIPLTAGTQNPYQAALYPEQVVNSAYGYVSAVRPGLSLRQYVHGGDWDSLRYGWYANDPFNGQIGAGAFGDRPGDYTFVFGGAVVHNADLNLNTSAIYASVAAVGADGGNVYGVRVNPPFRSAMGTLFTVNEQPYEAFFTPTSIAAGQVVNVGEPFILAGQAAPTLQSRVSVTVTAPDGTLNQFDGLTNAIGYFYDPAHNFTIDQQGVWTIRVVSKTVEATSEGLIGDDLPQGIIPGTSDSTFTIFATGSDNPPLTWNRASNVESSIELAIPAGGLINFSVNVPQVLTGFIPYYTISTSSFVLEQGTLRAVNPPAYQYSPPQLSLRFPTLETNTGVSGASGSDVVTITFAVQGVNEDGETLLYARTFHILHDRLISIEAE